MSGVALLWLGLSAFVFGAALMLWWMEKRP